MIFNKILKGTDLAFDISLEKTEYRKGEIVRGTLSLKTKRSSKARQLMLFAEGKESTIITVSENMGANNSRDTTSKTYRELNIFFSKDLSHLLQESISSNILADGTLEILPQNKVIAFDFTLPADYNNLFSSYKGKHSSITYAVKATADIAKKLDVNKEEQFSLINSNNKIVSYSGSTTFDADIKSDTINTNNIEKEENTLPSTIAEAKDGGEEEKDAGKENYEARFERIFGKNTNRDSPQNRSHYFRLGGTGMNYDLGTIFAKGREHFLKETSEAKINLTDHKDPNVPYSPGHPIKGELILLHSQNKQQEEMSEKVKAMKITLSGIEHAFAQGLQRVSTIEKYEKNVKLDGNEDVGKIDNSNAIPFKFEIPQGVNQSYIGRYSEYFWGLEAKLNIAWSSDINARTIIEIV